MIVGLVHASTAFNGPAPAAAAGRAASARMMNTEELKVLAKELNPVVGFWDPIGLSELDLWDQGEEATIGWLREARL